MSKSGEDEKKGFKKRNAIGLFTDTAAILNNLDLRSIMGCPEGITAIRSGGALQYITYTGMCRPTGS